MQNKNIKTQAPVGYRRFQIGCVFVEYDLFNTTTFIQLLYVLFCSVLIYDLTMNP